MIYNYLQTASIRLQNYVKKNAEEQGKGQTTAAESPPTSSIYQDHKMMIHNQKSDRLKPAKG